jgi:hypothetical protein
MNVAMDKKLEDMFNSDKQGRSFADVARSATMPWSSTLQFFDDPERQRRMIESEVHHDRPALAGVIREFEATPPISAYLSATDGHETMRFRQAVGVLVRIVMEAQCWGVTGRKGSLGTRTKVAPGTTTPGAYRNTGGLSLWFTRAERYERALKG